MGEQSRPILFILGGVNGAGKSTIAAELQEEYGVEITNPDVRTNEILSAEPGVERNVANLRAAQDTQVALERAIHEGRSIGVETVLSSSKYIPLVEEAKRLGYLVYLFYVGLPSVQDSIVRVATRVAEGGHDVPLVKLYSRWAKSWDNLGVFSPLVDQVVVYANLATERASVVVAKRVGTGATVHISMGVLPELDKRVALLNVNARLALKR